MKWLSFLLPAVLLAGLLTLAWHQARQPLEHYDVLIQNAQIADGTGAPLFRGSIAVRDGRIAAVGQVKGTATLTLDAAGKVAAPGFIDVHVHAENLTRLPYAENFLRMGVTTLVTGNCGSSHTNIAEFFQDVEATRCAINVATLIGHNSVRREAMGGNWDRPPTEEELEKMKALVAQGMRDGAVGLSTGLIYLPGTFAKPEEIIELAKVAASYGGIYASHMRAENYNIFSALDEVFRVAREAGIPAEVSHLKLSGPSAWGQADKVLEVLDQARAEGLRITHDVYAYTASSTTLSQMIPSWAREGTAADFNARLQDPDQKAAIIAGMKEMLKRNGRTDYSYAVIARFGPDASLNGKNIPEAAQLLRGSSSLEDQIETILDIHRRGSGQGVFHGMSEDDLRHFLSHPLSMVASDGGPRSGRGADASHPRSYGNNARVLARYVREQKLLSLEEAVRRMTSLPAQTFRLSRRGLLRPGAHADIVIFDLETVNDPATYEQPHQFAQGFSDVLVNGVPVILNGQRTEERPGGPVRLETSAQAL